MSEENKQMINDLVTKSIQVSTLDDSVLQPQYFNKFIQEATRERTILNDARRIVMDAQVVNIDRVGFSGRIMEAAVEDTAATGADPSFKQEQLTASEYIAMVGINDRSLRRNIEREGFTNTLISMATNQFGVDWETLAVFGDTTKFATEGSKDSLLASKNGWVAKCENTVYGDGDSADYDPDDVIAQLDAMIAKFPSEYLQRGNLRFYLDSDKFDAYIDEKGLRPTAVGDTTVSQFIAPNYKGIPVVEAPVLNDSTATKSANWGKTALLMNPSNMVYGIFHNITMEAEREAKLRKTSYIFTTEIDQGFENPYVGVVALDDQEASA